MRVIAGTLGGRRLEAPEGAVRPTQDKVRQALFSILGERVVGCRFLDLYAGSGSVGIEAWSRGATAVAWVELEARTVRVLRRNASLCEGGGRVVAGDAVRVVKKGLENGPFDIIFADPPYARADRAGSRTDWPLRLLEGIASGPALAAGGLVVLEEPEGSPRLAPAGWSLVDERHYGATLLRFYRRESGTNSEEKENP